MSQTLAKASGRPQETRSGHGQGMGSHLALQRLVGRSMRSVRKPDERMDFGQRGVMAMCSAGGSAWPIRASVCVRHAACVRVRENDPFAPHPSDVRVGATRNFSSIFR